MMTTTTRGIYDLAALAVQPACVQLLRHRGRVKLLQLNVRTMKLQKKKKKNLASIIPGELHCCSLPLVSQSPFDQSTPS